MINRGQILTSYSIFEVLCIVCMMHRFFFCSRTGNFIPAFNNTPLTKKPRCLFRYSAAFCAATLRCAASCYPKQLLGADCSTLAHSVLNPPPMAFPLTTPSPGINYNFVVISYLVCSLILVLLLALDKVGMERKRLCLLSAFFNDRGSTGNVARFSRRRTLTDIRYRSSRVALCFDGGTKSCMVNARRGITAKQQVEFGVWVICF